MRERGDKTPIMMLTARGETRDRIEGFDSDADDYLPKPFDPDGLLSRVRAMLRRSDAYRPSVLTFGDLTLDPGSGTYSAQRAGVSADGAFSALARDALFRRTADGKNWGRYSGAEINVIWVNISNLRKMLKPIGSHVQINASRGLGYLLETGK